MIALRRMTSFSGPKAWMPPPPFSIVLLFDTVLSVIFRRLDCRQPTGH